MDNFLALTETEKFKVLTKQFIFEPPRQIELLFDLHKKVDWKKRYALYKKVCSNFLIKWFPYFGEWARKGTSNKKLFLLKICYFLKESNIKSYIDSTGCNIKKEEILRGILNVIKELTEDPSLEVVLAASKTFSSIIVENNYAKEEWKNLLKNQKTEFIALAGAGEFLRSDNLELTLLTDYLKAYYEEEDLEKALKNLQKVMNINTRKREVFLIPLGIFHIVHPDIVIKVIERDFSEDHCFVNIIRSFSEALLYLNHLPRTEGSEKVEVIFRQLVELKNKKILPLLPLLKFSSDIRDYSIYEALLDVLKEFCYSGIYKAYDELVEFLNYEIPLYLKSQVISCLITTNLICKNKFQQTIKKIYEKIQIEDDLLYQFITLERLLINIKTAPFSPLTLDEIYKLIEKFNTASDICFNRVKPYDSISFENVKLLTTRFREKFIIEIQELLDLLKCYLSPEMKILIEKTREYLLNNIYWEKRFKVYLEDKENPEKQFIAINILDGERETFILLEPAFTSYNPVILASIGKILAKIFNKLIKENEIKEIINYVRRISLNNGEKLYEIIERYMERPEWFINLLKVFADFHKNFINWQSFLENIVFMKKNILKEQAFYQVARKLLALAKGTSIKTILNELEDFQIKDLFLNNPCEKTIKFIQEFSVYMDKLKKNLKSFMSFSGSHSLFYKNQEENLIKIIDEINKFISFVKEKGSYFLDKPVYLSLAGIFNLWKTNLAEKILQEIQLLGKEIEHGDLLRIRNQYLKIKENKLLDEYNIQTLDKCLYKEIQDIVFRSRTLKGNKEIIEFIRDLYKQNPEEDKEPVLINLFCKFLGLKDVRSNKMLASIFSDHFIIILKKEDYQSAMDLIMNMLEHGAGSEIFLFLSEELLRKKAPEDLISLIKNYAPVIRTPLTVESVNKFNKKLKELINKYDIKFNRLETYEMLLELAKGTGGITALSEKLQKTGERAGLTHALYTCFERNGFYLMENTNNPPENNRFKEEKQKNEKICLQILYYIEEFEKAINYVKDCTFEEIEHRLSKLRGAVNSLRKMRSLFKDYMLDPVVRNIMIHLFIDKLCIRKEEELEPDDTFSLVKLSERWQEVFSLIKAGNIEKLTEVFYYRKDLCNYLQLSGGYKEFKDFLVSWYYYSYEIDTALYLQYIDKTHRVNKGFSTNPPSPFNSMTNARFTFPLFGTSVIIIFFISFFLSPLISLVNQSTGSLILKYLFTFFLISSPIVLITFFILYILKKVNFLDIQFLFPRLLGGLIIGFIILCIDIKTWEIGVNIQDILFLCLFIASLLIAFFYLLMDILRRKNHQNSGHILAVNVLLLCCSEAFFIALILTTLLSTIFTINISQSTFFLFGILPREIRLTNIDFLSRDLIIYPPLVYTWTCIMIFVSVFLHTFFKERRPL
ncbi:MAG: hypothetical protein BWY64_01892 [bacterium ADurb.Bin363]|nr:MAG: hypothetical protein BWY64_01892 [bacterium ADurb.Bin363]